MFGIDFKKLLPVSGMAGRDLAGIDLSGNSVKLVHLKTVAHKFEVSHIAFRSISGLGDEEIAKVVRSSFGELNAKTPYITIVIPAHLVITKNIEIPSTNPQEIREIISLQAGRHTPYSRDEIIVDYIDIGTYKHSYTKILLIIVARQLIKRQFDILEKAGLKLERVLLAPEGIAWSASKILNLENQDQPASVIHLDEHFTDFTVIYKDKAIFIRNIPIGAQHLIDERERYQAKFAEEIKNSMESYQSEDIEKTPGSVILTGAVEDIRTLAPVLNETLRLPVKSVSYFRNILVSSDAFNKIALAKQVSFFGVIAPLLGKQELKINLIPEEVRLRRVLEERGRDLIGAGVLVLANFVVVFLILISKFYFGSEYLKKLNAKYIPLSQEAKKLENDFSRISLIKNYLSKRGFSLEVLTELYTLVTEEVSISDIRFDEQGKFSVRGTAETTSSVFSFVERMQKSNYFTDVKTKYTTKRREGTSDVTDFEIAATLSNKKGG